MAIETKMQPGQAPAVRTEVLQPESLAPPALPAAEVNLAPLYMADIKDRRNISVAEAKRLIPNAKMEELADTAWRRASRTGRHKCLRGIADTLIACDAFGELEKDRAIDAVRQFRHDPNYIEVLGVTMKDLKDLPEGLVVIYEKPGFGRRHAGHAQILCGDGRAASDFRHGLNVYASTPRQVWAFIPKVGLDEPVMALSLDEIGLRTARPASSLDAGLSTGASSSEPGLATPAVAPGTDAGAAQTASQNPAEKTDAASPAPVTPEQDVYKVLKTKFGWELDGELIPALRLAPELTRNPNSVSLESLKANPVEPVKKSKEPRL